ncbi:hypothetical protein [Streptomonospora nanhaiensis]|uniref:hypothetical protein n=1 Tax=Streptomonospora nanhaiensis TaxID=1323731 RepID=UPI001C38842C|nr:hypothetical protein [Streptomonospora nanhaiensis]MBV2364240.1 hypothetical protein [Streptomonospora nanhaiensis]
MTRFNTGGIIPGPADQVRRFGEGFHRLACRHEDAVPVESVVDGATLAWLCPGCDAQLEANWQGAL